MKNLTEILYFLSWFLVATIEDGINKSKDRRLAIIDCMVTRSLIPYEINSDKVIIDLDTMVNDNLDNLIKTKKTLIKDSHKLSFAPMEFYQQGLGQFYRQFFPTSKGKFSSYGFITGRIDNNDNDPYVKGSGRKMTYYNPLNPIRCQQCIIDIYSSTDTGNLHKGHVDKFHKTIEIVSDKGIDTTVLRSFIKNYESSKNDTTVKKTADSKKIAANILSKLVGK